MTHLQVESKEREKGKSNIEIQVYNTEASLQKTQQEEDIQNGDESHKVETRQDSQLRSSNHNNDDVFQTNTNEEQQIVSLSEQAIQQDLVRATFQVSHQINYEEKSTDQQQQLQSV